MKNSSGKIIISLIFFSLLLGLYIFTPKNKIVEIIKPSISLDENIYSDMIILDYASDDRIIFHGYFGLFIYDIKSEKIISSLDLESIGMHYTQGDNYCDVTVDSNGQIVQLNTLSKEIMYTFNIDENTLIKSKYKDMKNKSDIKLELLKIEDSSSYYITHGIKLEDGELGYLKLENNTIGSLEYIRGDKVYKIFQE